MAKMAEMRLMQPTATKSGAGRISERVGGAAGCQNRRRVGQRQCPRIRFVHLLQRICQPAQRSGKALVQPGTVRHFACGSTIKPAIAIAGLSEGVITSDQKGPSLRRRLPLLRKRRVRAAMHRPPRKPQRRGRPAEILQRFLFDLGRRLTIKPMNSYLTRFGFGVKTGIEIERQRGFWPAPTPKATGWRAIPSRWRSAS